MTTCPLSRQPATCPMQPCADCLGDWAERAAIAELDGKLSRADAENLATEILRKEIDR